MKSYQHTFSIIFVVFSILFLSSCVSLKEEIWANEDGSGTYHMTIDMSELMSFMNSMGGMDSNSDDSSNDPMDQLFKRIEDGSFSGDTIIYSNDLIAQAKANGEATDIPENMEMKVHYNNETEDLFFTFMFDYESLSELNSNAFFTGEDNLMNELGGGGGDIVSTLEYQIGNGKFTRKGVDLSKSKMFQNEGGEGADMMMSFFSKTTYTSVYYLPKKVKSVNIPNATVKGNTVTVVYEMDDLIKSKKTEDLEIKYKKKKFLGLF